VRGPRNRTLGLLGKPRGKRELGGPGEEGGHGKEKKKSWEKGGRRGGKGTTTLAANLFYPHSALTVQPSAPFAKCERDRGRNGKSQRRTDRNVLSRNIAVAS